MPNAEAAGGEPGLLGRRPDGGRDGVQVVLHEEADRQLPGGGQVEGLQRRADVDRPVAEVGDADVVGARPALVEGEPERLRHAAADDGVGAHRPGLAPLQVHRAAAAAAVALGQAADLGQGAAQHGPDRVVDLGEVLAGRGRSMTWPSALARNWWWPRCEPLIRSVGAQVDDRADRAALLADAGVRGPVDQAVAGQLQDVLLEDPDPQQSGPASVAGPRARRRPSRRSSLVSSTQGEAGRAGSSSVGILLLVDPFSNPVQVAGAYCP